MLNVCNMQAFRKFSIHVVYNTVVYVRHGHIYNECDSECVQDRLVSGGQSALSCDVVHYLVFICTHMITTHERLCHCLAVVLTTSVINHLSHQTAPTAAADGSYTSFCPLLSYSYNIM